MPDADPFTIYQGPKDDLWYWEIPGVCRSAQGYDSWKTADGNLGVFLFSWRDEENRGITSGPTPPQFGYHLVLKDGRWHWEFWAGTKLARSLKGYPTAGECSTAVRVTRITKL